MQFLVTFQIILPTSYMRYCNTATLGHYQFQLHGIQHQFFKCTSTSKTTRSRRLPKQGPHQGDSDTEQKRQINRLRITPRMKVLTWISTRGDNRNYSLCLSTFHPTCYFSYLASCCQVAAAANNAIRPHGALRMIGTHSTCGREICTPELS